MGGRRYRAAIDAILCLLHDINTTNNNKRVLSVLFFGVGGAFGRVSKTRLLDTMQRLHLHPAIIRWTDTFLSNRQIGLAFDGERENLQPVNTGIPQDHPSPQSFSLSTFDIYSQPFSKHTQQQQHPAISTMLPT